MLSENLDRSAREAFLEAAQYIVRTDGIIAPEEEQRMAAYRRELGVPEEEYTAVGDSDRLEEAMEVLKKLPSEDRRAVFDELENLAKCDNEYNSSEQIVVNAIRDMLHID